jgi:defect-in-organelle-trafficking protein DotB
MSTDKLKIENIPPVTIGNYVDRILEFCIDNDVSDVHILSDGKVKVDIHGRFHPIIDRYISYNEVVAYMSHIYEGGTVETRINSGQPIDKAHVLRYRGTKYRFRVNAIGCQRQGKRAIQITIRTIAEYPPKKDDIGLEDEIWNNFLPEQGVIFITGPTGSGKSTLLASAIREILMTENLNKKIVTYESPIEYVYDAFESDTSIITQSEVPNNIKSFKLGVEAALRRAPDIILVGEARDKETIDATITAAQTGHLVYTTTHTDGVASTMRRLLSVYMPDERNEKMAALIDSTHMIVTQRLEKTLDGKRMPIKEYLLFDRDVKDRLYKVNHNQVSYEITKILREKKTTMYDGAKKLFEDGNITEDQLKTIKLSYNG